VASFVDQVRIEAAGVGTIDNLTATQISNDLTAPSEGAFELGNEGTWASIAEQVQNGTEYMVFVNELLRLTGRVEFTDQPTDAQGGSTVRLTVRTKLADAMYASAKPTIKVKDTSIKEFILALYEPLGFTAADFQFSQAAGRDLLTGEGSAGAGDTVDLEPMKADEAKVNPPETVYDAADRHLRRHGLMHWDAPDGKIIVGAPAADGEATYRLILNQDGRSNNILACTPAQDWSGVPSSVTVIGAQRRKGTSRKRVAGGVIEHDVFYAGFHRPIVIQAEGITSVDKAKRAAAREMSARRRTMDCWDIEVDGLSWWDGDHGVGWSTDAFVEIESDLIGKPTGLYYIHRVVCRRDVNGDKTNLSVVRKGLWVL
jgi:prophage tail gpP-like protein